MLYGVYEFLRQYGGCIFSGPIPNGEYIPQKEKIEITPLPVRRKPKFWHRAIQLYSRTDLDLVHARIDWMGKNGYNFVAYNVYDETLPFLKADGTFDPATGEEREKLESRFSQNVFNDKIWPELCKRGIKLHQFSHNLLNFLPAAKYFQDHPEWYMFKDGKRHPHGCQLCLCTSNQDMVREYIKNVLTYMETNPDLAILSIGPQDGMGWCECDRCRALDDHPDDVFKTDKHFRSPEGENQSKIRRYTLFINAIARAVREKFPDRLLSYQGYVDLNFPSNDVPLEKNIVIHASAYWRCGAHSFDENACPANKFMGETFRRWCEVCPGRVLVGDNAYVGMGAQLDLPYPIDQTICEDWELFHKFGVGGNFGQLHDEQFSSYVLNYYAFGKTCWEEKVDPDTMLDEFLMGMFGKARKALRPIYDSFHQTIREIRQSGKAYSVFLQEQPKWKKIYPEKLEACLEPTAANIACFMDKLGEEKLNECLEQALNTAEDEREKEQVKAFIDVTGYWCKAAAFYRIFCPTDLYPDKDPEKVKESLQESIKAAEEVVAHLKKISSKRKGWLGRHDYIVWERKLRQIKEVELIKENIISKVINEKQKS